MLNPHNVIKKLKCYYSLLVFELTKQKEILTSSSVTEKTTLNMEGILQSFESSARLKEVWSKFIDKYQNGNFKELIIEGANDNRYYERSTNSLGDADNYDCKTDLDIPLFDVKLLIFYSLNLLHLLYLAEAGVALWPSKSLEYPVIKIKHVDELLVSSEQEIRNFIQRLPLLTTPELFIALSMLNDEVLRKFLGRIGEFYNLYDSIRCLDYEAFKISFERVGQKENLRFVLMCMLYEYQGLLLNLNDEIENSDETYKSTSSPLKEGRLIYSDLISTLGNLVDILLDKESSFDDVWNNLHKFEIIFIKFNNHFFSYNDNNDFISYSWPIPSSYHIIEKTLKLNTHTNETNNLINFFNSMVCPELFSHIKRRMEEIGLTNNSIYGTEDAKHNEVLNNNKEQDLPFSNYLKKKIGKSPWIYRECQQINRLSNPDDVYHKFVQLLYYWLIGESSIENHSKSKRIECSLSDFCFLLDDEQVDSEEVSSNPQIIWKSEGTRGTLFNMHAFFYALYREHDNDKSGFNEEINPGTGETNGKYNICYYHEKKKTKWEKRQDASLSIKGRLNDNYDYTKENINWWREKIRMIFELTKKDFEE